MSTSYRQSRVATLIRDIADLERRISDKLGTQANHTRKMADINRDLQRPSSPSQAQSRLRDLERVQQDLARDHADLARFNDDMSRKHQELGREQEQLSRDQERDRREQERAQQRSADEQRRRLEAEKRQVQELEQMRRAVHADILQRRASEAMVNATDLTAHLEVAAPPGKEYDFFISHATEDKEDFVEPLARELIARGVKVWYDRFQLRVGDSLRRSIDEGLARSRYGVVVLSVAFFAKTWPEYELNGLVAREMNGVKVILPIWHKVSKDEVLSFSPPLADKVALSSAISSVAEIAQELCALVQPTPASHTGGDTP